MEKRPGEERQPVAQWVTSLISGVLVTFFVAWSGLFFAAEKIPAQGDASARITIPWSTLATIGSIVGGLVALAQIVIWIRALTIWLKERRKKAASPPAG